MKNHHHHAPSHLGLLSAGLGVRLAVSLGAIALLWLAVFWALG
jgi:hypothetical protein